MFQSLKRDNERSDPKGQKGIGHEQECFNPSSGITSVLTTIPEPGHTQQSQFQSLKRDNERSDQDGLEAMIDFLSGFNPSSGITSVLTLETSGGW